MAKNDVVEPVAASEAVETPPEVVVEAPVDAPVAPESAPEALSEAPVEPSAPSEAPPEAPLPTSGEAGASEPPPAVVEEAPAPVETPIFVETAPEDYSAGNEAVVLPAEALAPATFYVEPLALVADEAVEAPLEGEVIAPPAPPVIAVAIQLTIDEARLVYDAIHIFHTALRTAEEVSLPDLNRQIAIGKLAAIAAGIEVQATGVA